MSDFKVKERCEIEEQYKWDLSPMFESDEAYVAYLRKICAQSDFQSNVSLSYTDRIITLSTCSYEYNDARYVVHGKLVPIHWFLGMFKICTPCKIDF